jgi:4-carboxymuconolactone decarboxylase
LGTFDAGLELRKRVLGSENVDAKLRDVDDFNRDVQRLVTEFAWGTVWTREGLSLRDRSLINLGMLTALNRPHELRSHVRGALNNGCTATEIRETLIQTAVYCGFPAALDAFRVARDEMHGTETTGER